ncbi:hypothetical protein BDV40DRAFT_304498 [Aspergillus tamarii]|uniref:Oligopeptide transporter n=1 Tax=Aspergillus tamarii TaxID=41984 RepID=A0A5N6UHV5_ASPTM|nr:hypothetical protein BDV40DRAFT_304498 [Aspergillus tamarii]
MARIVMGFLFLTLAIVYTAILHKLVYSAGPCYDHPLACAESDNGRIFNQISMFLRTPIYVLGTMAEIFYSTTGTEYAYNQALKSMKSVVQSVWMVTAGVGACLAMVFTPITKDPHLVIMYLSLAGVVAMTTGLFRFLFGRHDREKAVLLRVEPQERLVNIERFQEIYLLIESRGRWKAVNGCFCSPFLRQEWTRLYARANGTVLRLVSMRCYDQCGNQILHLLFNHKLLGVYFEDSYPTPMLK